MEVILNKDVEKIGKAGSIVRVKDGFARNFLFPQNLARPATTGSLKGLEQAQQARSTQLDKIKKEAEEVKQRLSKLANLTIPALTQGEQNLYGSIGAHDISAALAEEGFAIDKNMIELVEPIKSLGIYEIPVKLHPEVVALVKLWVVKK